MIGHRQRIYEKFLENPDSFTKRDLLEMICFLCIPRKNVKDLSVKIDESYDTILDFFNEPYEVLIDKFGFSAYGVATIKLFYEIVKRLHKEKFSKKEIHNVFDYIVEYCRMTMGSNRYEEFKVIFINNKNIIIKEETLFFGTLNNVSLYPREIFRRCFELKASAIVLVHNHPSGNCKPSEEDIQLTKIINQIGNYLSVSIYDHIIVSNQGFWSFRQNGLII